MRKILLINILLFLAFIACDREIPSPVSNPDTPELPPTPSNVEMYVGDTELTLVWSISDTTAIAMYRIYQADYADSEYEVIDSTETTSWSDNYLHNGTTYYYKISAVNTSNSESRLTDIIYGTPNLYSVIINDGDERTYDRYVTLTLVAPSTVQLMRISNSTDFSLSSWEEYASSKTWLLPQSTGQKTVYALFRDSDGNATVDTVSDSILLEVYSYQYSVSINNDDELAYSRDVELTIGAPDGTSYMMISNSTSFANADWEDYSATKSWHVTQDVADNREDVAFYVMFRDSNNDSVSVMAADTITLANADPVNLYPVYQAHDSYSSIDLSWSQSLSEDFESYRIFRSRGTNLADTMVTSIYDAATSSYTDEINITDMPASIPDSVYYMVRFYSSYQDSSDSDVILVTLLNNQPSILAGFIRDIVYDIDTLGNISAEASYGWGRSEITDFSYYVAYENTSLDSTTADPIYYSYDQSTLSLDINKSNVDTTEVYYYWVKVFDLGGRSSRYSAPDSLYY